MRVAMLAMDANLDDVSVSLIHTAMLARSLQKKMRVHTLVSSKKKKVETVEGVRIEGVGFEHKHGMAPLKLLKRAITNAALLPNLFSEARKAEIFYERAVIGHVSGLLAARLAGRPLVYELDGIMDEEICEANGIREGPVFNNFVRGIISWMLGAQVLSADACIVVTEELGRAYEMKFGLKKWYIVENGVEAVSGRTARRVPADTLNMVYVTTVDKFHEIADIAGVVGRQKRMLHVMGGGPMLEEYRKKFGSGNARFYGKMPRQRVLEFLMKNADVGIVNYAETDIVKKYGLQNCPLKLLEYMAIGIPAVVLGPTNSFIRKIEADGGCLVVKDINGFELILTMLARDKKAYTKAADAALKCSKKYTWERSAEQTAAVFEKVLAERR